MLGEHGGQHRRYGALLSLGQAGQQARYYDPALGRFLSIDPVEFSASRPDMFNRYAYAANDPVNIVDPDGRAPNSVGYWIALTPPEQKQAAVDSVVDAVAAAAIDAAPGVALEIASAVPAVRAARAAVASIKAVATAVKVVNDAKGEKSFQTYTKTNAKTGEVYSGRTSGTGTALENVANRDASHHMNDKGFGPAALDKSTSNAAAIRGREQQLIEANGGARSSGGTSGNAINGISPNNGNRSAYLDAAKREFGQ
jgi:RHS repeat-associated protein